jgi:hypothetical protein
MMIEASGVLEPGINKMRGLVRYVAGADQATSSLANVSIWRTLEDAHQMDRFQPMLNLADTFAAKGATFERSIMHYDKLWQIDSVPDHA